MHLRGDPFDRRIEQGKGPVSAGGREYGYVGFSSGSARCFQHSIIGHVTLRPAGLAFQRTDCLYDPRVMSGIDEITSRSQKAKHAYLVVRHESPRFNRL